jgi:putative transposase
MDTPLNIRWSRPLPTGAKPTTVTVTRDRAGRYFVSILVEEERKPLPVVNSMVGLDLGLTSMVVLSTGESVGNPRYFAKDEKKWQRPSGGTRNYQHKLSTRIIRENQVVCVESLAVKNMVKNHCLAKSISDVGWGEFVRQLDYKARWYGRTFVKIDQWYPSSKTCSACQHVLDSLPLDIRVWTCPICLAVHDRDSNAAKNILSEGLSAVNACGGSRRPVRLKGWQASPVETGNLTREGGTPLPL